MISLRFSEDKKKIIQPWGTAHEYIAQQVTACEVNTAAKRSRRREEKELVVTISVTKSGRNFMK